MKKLCLDILKSSLKKMIPFIRRNMTELFIITTLSITYSIKTIHTYFPIIIQNMYTLQLLMLNFYLNWLQYNQIAKNVFIVK